MNRICKYCKLEFKPINKSQRYCTTEHREFCRIIRYLKKGGYKYKHLSDYDIQIWKELQNEKSYNLPVIKKCKLCRAKFKVTSKNQVYCDYNCRYKYKKLEYCREPHRLTTRDLRLYKRIQKERKRNNGI